MQTFGSILGWAVSQGIIESNPAIGIKKPAGKKRERRLTPEEFKAFAEALNTAAKEPGQSWQPIAELRFLALTGCRLGEVEKLKWSEVDIGASIIHLSEPALLFGHLERLLES
jgi:integrase